MSNFTSQRFEQERQMDKRMAWAVVYYIQSSTAAVILSFKIFPLKVFGANFFILSCTFFDSQIQWTTSCTRTLTHCKIMSSKKPLKKFRKKMVSSHFEIPNEAKKQVVPNVNSCVFTIFFSQDQVLIIFSEAVRGNLTKIQRLKIVGLVTIEIHARDVIEQMYKAGKCILSLLSKVALMWLML